MNTYGPNTADFGFWGSPFSAAYRCFSGAYRGIFNRVQEAAPSQEVVFAAGLLCLLQVMDGFLTAWGVSFHGISAEGNPLIRTLMESIGTIPALIFVKSFAIIIIALLVVLAEQIAWMAFALRTVAAIYLFSAVIPWSGIILKTVA
jgi:hypothetical protein